MRILFLAPHPFYQERGTPIAVRLLLGVLAEAGHQIDVLTYHEGSDVPFERGVTIRRIRPPPLARGIKPGFSFKKLLCDAAMLPAALRLADENAYDVVHAVEESVFMAMRIRRRFGLPYVYDMDSSMAQQLVEKMPLLAPVSPFFRWMEARAIRGAAAVAPMCDALADLARTQGARRVVVLRDVPLFDPQTVSGTPDVLADLGLRGTRFLYVGNLERYQGIDLLLDAFARFVRESPAHSLVVVGGTPGDVEKYTRQAAALGIGGNVRFTGPKPVSLMGSLFGAADVLVSPRTKGVNTPMKIYSYLLSGRPILATDIASHTQVLTADCALLAAPRAEVFAEGMRRLAADPALRERLGANARRLAQAQYSLEMFRSSVLKLYGELTPSECGPSGRR